MAKKEKTQVINLTEREFRDLEHAHMLGRTPHARDPHEHFDKEWRRICKDRKVEPDTVKPSGRLGGAIHARAKLARSRQRGP